MGSVPSLAVGHCMVLPEERSWGAVDRHLNLEVPDTRWGGEAERRVWSCSPHSEVRGRGVKTSGLGAQASTVRLRKAKKSSK